MFLDTSRYARVPTDTVTTADGRETQVIRLRPLPPTSGQLQYVKDGDRLDVLAERRFGDGTRGWHIGDANTALDTRELVATVLDTFKMPAS